MLLVLYLETTNYSHSKKKNTNTTNHNNDVMLDTIGSSVSIVIQVFDVVYTGY